MTLTTDEAMPATTATAEPTPPSSEAPEVPESVETPSPDSELRLPVVTASAALSSAAAAWLGGGLIRGVLPQLIALLGVAIGTGLTYLSLRWRRTAVQYAVVPVAAVVGAVLIMSKATGGTANLPGLVGEAIRGGGLDQPPIAFDPGWRFILVVLFAIVAAAATSTAVTSARPKLAVLVPMPILIGAALLQPPGRAVVASSVATVLFIGSLAVSFGADASGIDAHELARSFELRRLLRGAALLLLVVLALVALAQTRFLFPAANQQKIIPPRKPPNVPMEKDRVLFREGGTYPGPFRLGVLDEYDGSAWLLPPGDPRRLQPEPGGAVPPKDLPAKASGQPVVQVPLTVVDMRGDQLPVPSGLLGVRPGISGLQFDPRTQVPQLPSRLPANLGFTASYTTVPDAADLDKAAAAPPDVQQQYTAIPAAPGPVLTLLEKAPLAKFSRLQYLRTALYSDVTLTGGGGPVDISPARVGQLLQKGAHATPFEVAAAEAMLARWAGVPARIGYGYYGGDPVSGGLAFHPRHGRAWLEAYFGDYGWVPLVGTPPHAAASLSSQQKLKIPNVRPSADLALVVYIPVERPTFLALFQIIRYWLLVSLPIVAGIALLLLGYPAALKVVRSVRRRRWARSRGPIAQALLVYAEFRDRCHDLNLGEVRDYPVEFVERFRLDDEHDELGWLVTRLFWGDLRRDPREDDVHAVRRLTASVQQRILAEQAAGNRILGWISRASLRDPYVDTVPNFYPHPWRRIRAVVRRMRRAVTLRSIHRLRPAPAAAVLVVVAMLLSGCAAAGQAAAPSSYPARILPDRLFGLTFVREPAAEAKYAHAGALAMVSQGRVYTIHQGTVIQGAIEIAVFKPKVNSANADVRQQVEQGVGGAFETSHFGTARVRYGPRPDQRLYLWFPPERNLMVLFILRSQYASPDDLVRAVIAYMRGIDPKRLVSVTTLEA